MESGKELVSRADLLGIIEDFVAKASGLSLSKEDGEFLLTQTADSKFVRVKLQDLADILLRRDPQGREFVQVNFVDGQKILLTDQLIGFKPKPTGNIDSSKLPKVVTTLDLVSVVEAIDESLNSDSSEEVESELEVLKNVFRSIVQGGEQIGFDLTDEKSWLRRLPTHSTNAAA